MPKRKKKTHSEASAPLLTPDSVDEVTDLSRMSLQDFKIWSDAALKSFLSVRGKPTDGPTEELVARAFIAWEDGVMVDPEVEHAERQNLAEYKAKLLIKDGVLPDPFGLTDGWQSETSCQNWPSLYFWDIANYLRMKTPAELYRRLCNEYKQGKAYRYFTSGWVKEVHYHPIDTKSLVCFLSAKVTPSMSLSARPYKVWACVKKDKGSMSGGEIICAYCTCTAGLQGSCNHVAGLLFRVEYAVRTGLTKPTCTSVQSVWEVPGKLNPSKPIRVTDLTWKKDQYFNQSRDDRASSVAYLASKFTPMSDSRKAYLRQKNCVQRDFADGIRDLAPKCCFIQLYDQVPFPRKKTVPCPPAPIELAKDVTDSTEPVVDLLKKMSLTSEEISVISKNTKGQATSQAWKDQRIGRVTASNAQRVYTRSQTLQRDSSADPSSLVRSIMGYQGNFETAATKHGLSMEPHAKLQYLRVMKKSHKKFSTNDSGLLISKEHSFVAASPDLLTFCACHGNGLCEIKCPYSIRDVAPTSENYKHVDKEGKLSVTSPHYYQIMVQLGVSECNHCDYFVFTSFGHIIDRVYFNQDKWNSIIYNLSWFWKSYIAPELLSPTYGTPPGDADRVSDTVETTHSQQPSTSAGPLTGKDSHYPVLYLCPICKTDCDDCPSDSSLQSVECSSCLMWFHFKCANISVDENTGDLPLIPDDWSCKECLAH